MIVFRLKVAFAGLLAAGALIVVTNVTAGMAAVSTGEIIHE